MVSRQSRIALIYGFFLCTIAVIKGIIKQLGVKTGILN